MAKNVLVTGGTTGIGLATAQRFAAQGCNVVITGRNQDRIDSAIETLGGKIRGVVADHSMVVDNQRVADFCRDELGTLDVVICNAGICLASHIDTLAEKDFDYEMGTNFKGPLFLIQSCLPLLKEGASIIVTTSVNDVKGIAGQVVYSATKAALRSAVRTLAVELAPRGIRVNAVAPGPIDTPIFDKAATTTATAQSLRDYEAQIPALKRLGKPDEIASVFEFLASEQAKYMTGADVRVDGGWGDI
ncbi:SDR family oxidoreductase [Pseudomonas sp. MOB-449]|nr:SDR family oxidoreductase [Pseudomonas sp. MOB-449]